MRYQMGSEINLSIKQNIVLTNLISNKQLLLFNIKSLIFKIIFSIAKTLFNIYHLINRINLPILPLAE